MHYGKFAVGESLTRYMRGMYRREMKAKRLAEQTPQRRCQTTRVDKAVKYELVE
jgi:hypothetical protein